MGQFSSQPYRHQAFNRGDRVPSFSSKTQKWRPQALTLHLWADKQAWPPTPATRHDAFIHITSSNRVRFETEQFYGS